MTTHQMTLKEYAREEIDNIRSGEGFVATPELRRRWGYAPPEKQNAWRKLMWKLSTGRHPSGQRLIPVLSNSDGPVFRIIDVLRVELGLQEWRAKRRSR